MSSHICFLGLDKYNTLLSKKNTFLENDQLAHLRKVLRKQGEFNILCANGSGRALEASLTENNTLVPVGDKEYIIEKKTGNVHLIQAPIKRRGLDFLLEKVSELGVQKISYIDLEHTSDIFEYKKFSRARKIIEKACMQSKNLFLPEINEKLLTIDDVKNLPQNNTFYGDWGDQSLSIDDITEKNLKKEETIYFINGPEGGFSNSEKTELKNRFRSIRLSQNVLRSETAAMIAVSVFGGINAN